MLTLYAKHFILDTCGSPGYISDFDADDFTAAHCSLQYGRYSKTNES